MPSPGRKGTKRRRGGDIDQCLQRGFLKEGGLRQDRVEGKERVA